MRPRIYANGDVQYVLDGLSKRSGDGWLPALGWQWARGVGGPGAWVTSDPAAAQTVAELLGLQILPGWQSEKTVELKRRCG